MTYLCISVRQNGFGKVVHGSFIVLNSTTFAIETPLTHVGPKFQLKEGAFDTLDSLIGSLSPSTTVVTWLGYSWFHQIGPNAAKLYPQIVDLYANFVAQNRHCISLMAFDCVEGLDANCASTVSALVNTIQQKGRLTWKTRAGNTSAFWMANFYTPLLQLKHKTPPEWLKNPETIELFQPCF